MTKLDAGYDSNVPRWNHKDVLRLGLMHNGMGMRGCRRALNDRLAWRPPGECEENKTG
ncbi:MAG TPA: hypothetical protein VN828_07945 [Acidobacteriaceae bacterium]|nr:hypothetical protein [Acidobacteriaceae bacterium]